MHVCVMKHGCGRVAAHSPVRHEQQNDGQVHGCKERCRGQHQRQTLHCWLKERRRGRAGGGSRGGAQQLTGQRGTAGRQQRRGQRRLKPCKARAFPYGRQDEP